MKKILSSLAFFIFVLLPLSGRAAVLTMEAGSGKYGPGDSFAVDIKVDLDTGCINTVEVEIVFDKEYLTVENFLSGESILSIWVEMPKDSDLKRINNTGKIYFAGGIPGGYCGKVAGDPGGRTNIAARIIFSVPKLVVGDLDRANIYFTDNTRVLLNDGLGTTDVLKTNNLNLELSPSTSIRDESWQEQIKTDRIPPEPFIIELHKNEQMFEGRYYIIFATGDKQSGMDRFEIMEESLFDIFEQSRQKKWYERFFREEAPEAPGWIEAQMPYPLKDQSLRSVIRVKAIDKAGNERLVDYIPPDEMRRQAVKEISQSGSFVLLLIMAAVGSLSAALIIVIVYKLIKRRKYDKGNNLSAEK
jgi:hypothetical protein